MPYSWDDWNDTTPQQPQGAPPAPVSAPVVNSPFVQTPATTLQLPAWLQNFANQSVASPVQSPSITTPPPAPAPVMASPYSSVGSQTRMDELPPTPAPQLFSPNPFYGLLPKPDKPLFDVPQFLSDVTPDNVEQALAPLGQALNSPVPNPGQLPVVGPVLQGAVKKGAEALQGYQEHVVEPTVGNVLPNNLMLKANPIPATVKAIQTGKAEDWNTAFGLPIQSPGESPAQRIAGKVNQGDIAGAAQELWKSFEQPGREAYSELDPASQLVGSLLFDPMNFVPGLGIGAAQKFRKVAQATTDVTKVGEAVADAPFLARLWDNLNPLARAAEGELLDVGKLGLKQAAAPDSVGGLANAARKMAEGVNPLTAFQKTPLARAIDWTQRVHDYLLPLASDARTTFADMVRLNERSQEALRAGKFTDGLKQVVSDVKTVNSADFQRAVHGTLNFKQPEAVMASYRRGQEMLEGINQWTQAARPNLSKLRETLLDTRPFSEAYGDASKLGDLTANQRGAFQRFAKTLDAYETGAGGAGASELRAATRQLQSDLEQIAKLEYADAWVTHTGSVVKGLANLPDEVQLADKIINKIRAYESVLLLGANPHYVAQNIVSDWVRLGMHGVNPMESAEDIGRTFNRAFGTSDLKTIMGEAAEQLSKADARYLPNAPYGASVPARVSNLPIIKQLGDLNKTMNARSQLRSFATGFRRTFKTNWKYGTTLPAMPEQLAQAILAQGGEKALKSVIKRLENSFNTSEMRDALTTPFPMWETYADTITPALNDILKKNGIDFQATPEMLDHLINHSTGDFVNETLQRVIQRVNKEGAENYARIWDEEAAGVQRRHVDWKKQADAFEAENFGKPAPVEPQAKPAPVVEPPIEQAAPVPENAPDVTPLDENPLAPANLPDAKLTEGQQNARDYLLSLKNAEGAPQYTAEQLATWKPETLERFAGELSSFDDILRTFTAKTGKDATKSGDYLKNLLNAEITRKGFKDPQIEKIAPFRDMADIQARADEAYRLLRGYDTYPTLQEGEFKWQLRVKMLEDEMPQELQDGVETIYDALANTAAKRAGMDVDTWWTKRAAGIEGAPATGNVRGIPQRLNAENTKGATDFLRDGRALLRFFKGKADASTYVHEAAHLFMPTLDASDMDELAKWTGLNNGDELRLLHERWARGDKTLGDLPKGKRAELQFREMGKATSDAERYAIAQEKFARGFEKYLAEGVAPTEGLQRVFDQFKDFLMEIYRGVTGSEIDVTLTDEMRALYGRMLDEAAPLPAQTDTGQFTLFQDVAERLKDPTAPTDPNLKADVETAMANELLRILKPYLESDVQNYGRALDPITNELIEQYLYQIEPNLTDMKRAASQVGRWYHQHTTMDYSQRWNVDDAMNYIAPFTFFPLHMAANFAQDFLDKPALFAMYAKLQNEVDQQSKDLPSRFSHRIKIPMPFLPDWMGDGMFVDPFATAFPVRQVFNLDDLERATWQSQNGEPMDNAGLIADMYGTHLPYKLGYQLLMGDKASLQDTLANLPPVRMAKAFGLNPETEIAGTQPFKSKWDNFYLQRAAGDMVANGELDEKRMRIALLTRKGADWDRIVERSRLQNYTAPQLSGWTGFTGKVYPAGELRYNEARLERDRLKESLLEQFGASPTLTDEQQYEYLKAKGAYDAGGQLRQFLDAHPELERGGAFQETDEMYRDYLKDGIWDTLKNATDLQNKLWRAQLGDEFDAMFRKGVSSQDFDKIPVEQLLGWANALKVNLPEVTDDLRATPDPYQATFPSDAQNKAYTEFRSAVENSVGWDTYYELNKKYWQMRDADKANGTHTANEWTKTPEGKQWAAVKDAQTEFYKDHPDIQTLLEQAGAIEIKRATDKPAPAAGSEDAQKQAWSSALTAVGYASYDEYKQENEAYFALPKGSQARRDYLASHPRLARQWAAKRALYDQMETSQNAPRGGTSYQSSKPYARGGTSYQRTRRAFTPRSYGRPKRDPRFYTMSYAALWRAMGQRSTYQRIRTEYPKTQYRRSPRLG